MQIHFLPEAASYDMPVFQAFGRAVAAHIGAQVRMPADSCVWEAVLQAATVLDAAGSLPERTRAAAAAGAFEFWRLSRGGFFDQPEYVSLASASEIVLEGNVYAASPRSTADSTSGRGLKTVRDQRLDRWVAARAAVSESSMLPSWAYTPQTCRSGEVLGGRLTKTRNRPRTPSRRGISTAVVYREGQARPRRYAPIEQTTVLLLRLPHFKRQSSREANCPLHGSAGFLS